MRGLKVVLSCSGKFHAFNVAEQLHQRGALHTFYTSYAYQKNIFWRPLAKRVDLEDIPVEKIRTLIPWAIGRKMIDIPWLWNDFFDRWVAWKLRFQTDYDVFIGWAGMSAHSLKVARQMGKKTILIRSSAHIEIQNELLRDEFARVGQKFAIPQREIAKELEEYKLADVIHVPSTFAMQSFLQKGFKSEQLFLNPLGVNLTTFQRLPHVENPVFSIVFLGNVSFQKGILDLYAVLEILAQRGRHPQVILIGQLSEEVAQWLKSKPAYSNLLFKGHIPQHELSEILSTCHIGLVPSIHDGFAQVIPQLLATGIPVITTTHTGGPEMIRDDYNGYIVPIHSPERIAVHIQYLMDHPNQLQQMSQHARPSVSQGFSWDDYGKRDYEFLHQLLNPSRIQA